MSFARLHKKRKDFGGLVHFLSSSSCSDVLCLDVFAFSFSYFCLLCLSTVFLSVCLFSWKIYTECTRNIYCIQLKKSLCFELLKVFILISTFNVLRKQEKERECDCGCFCTNYFLQRVCREMMASGITWMLLMFVQIRKALFKPKKINIHIKHIETQKEALKIWSRTLKKKKLNLYLYVNIVLHYFDLSRNVNLCWPLVVDQWNCLF